MAGCPERLSEGFGFFYLPAIVHEPLEKGRNIARFNLAAMKKFSRNSHRSAPD